MDTLSEPAFRWTLGGLLAVGLGLRAYFQRQAQGVARVARRGGRRDQRFYVLVLGSYLLMFVYVFTPWLDGAQIALPAWARWSGALIAAGGIGLFCWSHLALGANWSGIVELAQGHRLVEEGPYRYVRHPMYSAFFVMGFGLLLLSANWLLGVVHLGAVTGMYRARVDDEEALMSEHFGDAYRAYLARTGRLLPQRNVPAQPKRAD
jgi:protein-S-isoprenylcysteine O-methyltransferase Ste14